jgi:drug/metabolite transporter (DMT)-like permease
LNIVTTKFKEVLTSIVPVVGLVLFLHFALTPLEPALLGRFLIGAVSMLFGFTIFLIGVDIGVIPLSSTMGAHIVKSNRMWVVIVAGLVLGFVIAIAEPVIHVLGGQIEAVTAGIVGKNVLVLTVSVGIGLMLALGLVRIVKNLPLNRVLTAVYIVIVFVALFVSPEFLAMGFDSMAAITGAFTIPFLLALGIGMSRLKKDSKASEEDSFGLIGIAATGAVICVMLLSASYRTDGFAGTLEQEVLATSNRILQPFVMALPVTTFEVFSALAPIVLIFLVFQKTTFRLSRKAVRRIMFGMLFTFVGLIFFLLGVNVGFMEVGSTVGFLLAESHRFWVLPVGFVLGFLVTLAEPAVHVLTDQYRRGYQWLREAGCSHIDP